MIATARQQLHLGVEAPEVADAVRATMHHHHQGPGHLGCLWARDVAIDRVAVADADFHRVHRRERLAGELRAALRQRLDLAGFEIHENVVARAPVAGYVGNGEPVVARVVLELHIVFGEHLADGGVLRSKRVVLVQVLHCRVVVIEAHGIGVAVEVGEQRGHIHLGVANDDVVGVFLTVVEAEAGGAGAAVVERVPGVWRRSVMHGRPARAGIWGGVDQSPAFTIPAMAHLVLELAVDAIAHVETAIDVGEQVARAHGAAGEAAGMAVVDVEAVSFGKELGAVAEDQDVVGIVGQEVQRRTDAERAHRAGFDVHRVQLAGGHEEVGADPIASWRGQHAGVREPEHVAHLLALAEVVVDDGFAARIGEHLKSADAINPHELGKVLAVRRNGNVAEFGLVHERTDGRRLGRTGCRLIRMRHQAQSNDERHAQPVAPHHAFPSNNQAARC